MENQIAIYDAKMKVLYICETEEEALLMMNTLVHMQRPLTRN